MPRVIHFELPADDPQRAITFYTQVFGWQIHKWDGPQDYWLITTGAETPGIDGAIMTRTPDMQGPVNTIDVISVDDTVAQISAHGGSVISPKMPIPGVGYFAYCRDTEGTLFGVMQSDPAAT